MDKRHRRGVQRRRKAGKDNWKALKAFQQPFILLENDGCTVRMEIVLVSYHSPHTSFLFSPLKPPLNSHVVIMLECALSHSFIVCVSPQHVTPASAKPRVVVCSQRAWGWRRLQTFRFTPREPAPESSKSPSRGPVSYTATLLVFTIYGGTSLTFSFQLVNTVDMLYAGVGRDQSRAIRGVTIAILFIR